MLSFTVNGVRKLTLLLQLPDFIVDVVVRAPV
jgi:hypothetical protein